MVLAMAVTRERAASALRDIFGSALMRALTESARLELVRLLLEQGPLDVSALANQVPQERSVVSRHLKVLEEAGIVEVRKQGRFRVYALSGVTLVAQLEGLVQRIRALMPACCPPADAPKRSRAR